MGKLDQKTVVLTGAVAGMGNAIAESFLREGANLVAVDRQAERLKGLREKWEKEYPGKIEIYIGDVSQCETDEAMIDLAVEKFGRLDILINDAGIGDDMAPLDQMTDEIWNASLQVNLFGPVYAMRRALKQFLKQGDGGNIINVTSVGARHNTSGPSYVASKAGLAAVTRNVAFMYKEQEIRCNAVAPGGIVTELPMTMPPMNEDGMKSFELMYPLSTGMGEPEDIANAVLFLASDESKFINGTYITVDGGWTNI